MSKKRDIVRNIIFTFAIVKNFKRIISLSFAMTIFIMNIVVFLHTTEHYTKHSHKKELASFQHKSNSGVLIQATFEHCNICNLFLQTHFSSSLSFTFIVVSLILISTIFFKHKTYFISVYTRQKSRAPPFSSLTF